LRTGELFLLAAAAGLSHSGRLITAAAQAVATADTAGAAAAAAGYLDLNNALVGIQHQHPAAAVAARLRRHPGRATAAAASRQAQEHLAALRQQATQLLVAGLTVADSQLSRNVALWTEEAVAARNYNSA
ncbi:hypothetical protein Agub_g10784, partial [Astrephomene gubernaculifera]